jgi:hypothetical protein
MLRVKGKYELKKERQTALSINARRIFERSTRLDPGKHSVPSVVNISGRKFVFKRSSKGQALTLGEAKMMISAVKKYHALLKKAGVNISEIAMIAPVRDYSVNGRNYFIGSLEQFIHKDNLAQTLASVPKNKAISVFSQLITELNKATSVPGESKTKTGLPIDSKPKNYVLGPDGKVYFIDFYTPKLLDGEGKLYPFIERLHKTRTHSALETRFKDKRAIFHILLAESIATRPQLRREFERIVFDFLSRQGENEVLRYLMRVSKKNYLGSELVKQDVLDKIPK